MKNKIGKISIVLVILILLFTLNTQVQASTLDSVIDAGDRFMNKADRNRTTISEEALQDVSSFLYNTLQAAGVIIAVIVATVLGIQFMIGGAEGQAKVKELIIPFVIGCIVVFGAFRIWELALNIGNKVETGTSELPKTEQIYYIV